MRKLLKDRRGEGNLLALVVALAILMISCAAYEYIRLIIIAKGVRDAVQSAVISVATTNYDEVYNGLREGYSGGYLLSGDNWIESMDTGDIYGQIDRTLGLSRQGGKHVKYAGGLREYAIWGLSIKIKNAPFAPTSMNSSNEFLATATIELEAPLSFGWEGLPPMRVTLNVKSGYIPKF